MEPKPPTPRVVKPRRRNPRHYQVVAMARGVTLTEEGELGDADSFTDKLPTLSSTVVVRLSVADYVAEIDKRFSVDPTWQWRASVNERGIIYPGGHVGASRVSTVIHYFGWKGGYYHATLDPVAFYGRSFDDVYPGESDRLYRLMEWGVKLRDWCAEQGVMLKPTAGAIGAQFLTDSRFYPEPRRKVPAATNATVREHLPGNHYQLFAKDDGTTEYNAIYLDQRRAHHYHARTTRLPCSNRLYAYGRFHNLEGTFTDLPVPDFSGLYCLRLRLPQNLPPYSPIRHPPATVLQEQGKIVTAFVYSNELSLLDDLGYTIVGVVAAWGSLDTDIGIPAYAQWAENQLDSYGDPSWLKPILLSTYGVLAIKPKELSFIFSHARNGEPVTLMTGHHRMHGILVKATSGKKIEPGIANVLHRAMIEAGTRADSLGLAHYLTFLGHNVLSIYADAVIVQEDADNPLPSLPDPWRRKETLTHLQFLNTQAFMSSEMTKIPGSTGRSDILKVARGSHKRAPRRQSMEAISGRLLTTDRRI